MIDLFKLSGILGLILITLGVLLKKRKIEDVFYILGGIFLTIYSIHIKDAIFITLQVVFIVAAIYDLVKQEIIEKKN
jgi:hypothetical protein